MAIDTFSQESELIDKPTLKVREWHKVVIIVLVWIHGGGLIFDSSTIEIYNGQTLASRADAVVVSMNYRLSTIGFMYSDEVPEIRGNQGLWDQTLALKWVQENIHNFGGNPNQVTIVGESAGAWSVSAHILSPISRDLFRNAILMSGSALFKTVQYPDKMVERLLKGIRKVGCATEQDLSIDQKVVDCLEKLDAKLVDQIAYAMNNNSMDFPGIVTVDGEFLPEHPLKMLQSGNHKKNFNILFDTVEDEGSFLLYFSQIEPKFLRENPKPITLDEAKQYLLDLLADKVLYTQNLPNKTINSVYFSGLNANFDSQDSFRRQVGIAYGDLMLTCPTIEFARQIFESSPDTVQVYQWYYSAKVGDKLKWSCSQWSGTCHGNDLNPLFGSPFRHPEKYHNRERDISNEVINFVKEFIRTGKPGRDQQEWQSYFMENGKPIAPYYEIDDSAKSFESFKFNLKQLECDQIWSRFIHDLKY